MQQQIGDTYVRLGVLVERVHPAAFITEAQANEVSLKVKALAEALTNKDTTKNHYQGIFGALYRRFGVASYKMIRQEQYTAVLAFLDDWAAAASAGEAPSAGCVPLPAPAIIVPRHRELWGGSIRRPQTPP